ncbi:MAG TPA: hypothetical protein DCZ04_12630 [Syntrophorhabdus aromaticivorans]|nr:hypothetical protein [Syntrophorhabdus aromaticivorans]
MFIIMFYSFNSNGIAYALLVDMKIAIAHWLGRVSPLFDVSDKLCLIGVEGRREVSRENITLTVRDPFGRAKEVAEFGTDVLLCGAISHVLERALIGSGIRVIGFLCGELDPVMAAFLEGRLSDGRFFMPGCRAQRQRHRFRGTGGRC